jgi:hypothetical protein
MFQFCLKRPEMLPFCATLENFIEIGAAVKLLLENNSEREKFQAKGYERAKEFHPAYFSEKMISLYSRILA